MTLPQDFRERLPDLLDERAPQRAPEGLFDRFAERMESAPQRPGWATRERWFPMPTEVASGELRRTLTVMGAMLLLVLAMAASFAVGSRLLVSNSTIIVAADGSGHVRTLAEGVAMARGGDTLQVRPGTYTEVVTITQRLEILGDGDIESIIIRATDDGPSIESGALVGRPPAQQRYALLIVKADPTIRGLTFSGEPSAVVALGGAPTIVGNRFEGVGRAQMDEEPGTSAITVGGGSRATVSRNRMIDSGSIATFDLSEPRIEGNVLSGGAHILGGFGDAAEIRDNRVSWAERGIEARGDAAPLIEGNIITDVEHPIRVQQGSAIIRDNHVEHDGSPDAGIGYDDGSGEIAGNTINGYARGVAGSGFSGRIIENTIDSGFEGVKLTDSTGTVSDNRIKAVYSGITLSQSSPDVVDNSIDSTITGVSIEGEASAPRFSGNSLCGTTQQFTVSDGAAEPDPNGLGACVEP